MQGQRRVGRGAAWICGAALALGAFAAPAQAAPSAAFQLTVPAKCVAGSCRVTATYAQAFPNERRLKFDVDWDFTGVFTADRSRNCRPASPYRPASNCTVTSPTYRTPGTFGVAVRITDTDGSQSSASQRITVRRKPGSTPTRDELYAQRVCPRPSPARYICAPGKGRKPQGGADKVPQGGWPRVTGVLWLIKDSRNYKLLGGERNDELLGHHGSDRVTGGAGHDILWGDWDPKNNNTRQRDTLTGGAGNDWLYPSHGRNRVSGGPGRDHVWAYYGRGTIDCGPGRDVARVRLNGPWKTRNCEKIEHFCAFGSDGRGGCRKPGEQRALRRLRSPHSGGAPLRLAR